jgi:transcriptional regulator with XRE-family HTH domain
MDELGERLLQIIKNSDIKTIREFAKKSGYTEAAVSNIVHGKSSPKTEFIVTTLRLFPDVNAHWLLTGKDPAEEIRAERNYLRGKVSRYENKVKELVKLLSNRVNPQQTIPFDNPKMQEVFA